MTGQYSVLHLRNEAFSENEMIFLDIFHYYDIIFEKQMKVHFHWKH